jgi:hypothetical protein
MNYNYYAKQDHYAYLAGGVQAWDLLLPNNIGLKKGDTVQVIETNDEGEFTGRSTTGTIVFNGVDGILTVNGNRDFYYINNLTTTNMFTEYRAIITQSGTLDPVVTELFNNTTQTFTWSRQDTGIYKCAVSDTLSGFNIEFYIGTSGNNRAFMNLSTLGGDGDCNIQTWNGSGTASDDLLYNTAITIRLNNP